MRRHLGGVCIRQVAGRAQNIAIQVGGNAQAGAGYTFPVVMDTTGDVLSAYGISAFPTTFMIDTEGNVFGYVTGQLTADMMESIVTQTMTGQRVS